MSRKSAASEISKTPKSTSFRKNDIFDRRLYEKEESKRSLRYSENYLSETNLSQVEKYEPEAYYEHCGRKKSEPKIKRKPSKKEKAVSEIK